MNYLYMAIIGLAVFVAVWIMFVVPAERRHHERKMELIRKKIERRVEQSAADEITEPGGNSDDSV